MPAYKPVPVEAQHQNWSHDQSAWFYHTGQGTELLPYKWFLALDQPKLQIFGAVPKFSDTSYLARFGFLPDPQARRTPADYRLDLA